MNIKLFGNIVEISEKTIELNKIMLFFKNIKKRAYKDFKKKYGFFDSFLDSMGDREMVGRTAYSKIDYYSNATNKFGENFILPYVQDARKLIAEYGIYTISESEIFFAAFGNDYTDLTKEMRNFANRLQHDTRNADWKLNRLYAAFRDGEMNNAIENDLSRVETAVMGILEKAGKIECGTVNNYGSSVAIYKNLRDGLVPIEKQRELIIEMIASYPLNVEYYELIFLHFPDERYEIVKLARAFSFDMNKLLDECMNKEYDVSNFDTEEKAIRAREKLDKDMQAYGITGCTVSDKLDKLLKEYDEKARTFKGVMYDTREIKAKAEKQDAEISEICKELFSLNREACIELAEKLNSAKYIETIINPYLNSIQERIDQLEKTHLEELSAAVETLSESECNELLKKFEELGYDDKNTAPFIDKVNARIEAIWDKEDFDKFSEMYLGTKSGDIVQKQSYIKFIEKTGRTESKQKFIDAFENLTSENLMVAAKYANATEKGGIAKITRLGKGYMYKILTIEGTLKHPEMENAINKIKHDEEMNGGFWKNIFSSKKY